MATQDQLESGVGSGSFEAAPSVVMISDPTGMAAEGIAALRTQLITGHEGQVISPLAVCAPSRSTGATFVAVNLAVALAQVGTRTLLIDGDLREPGVQDLIVPGQPVQGLHQYLTQEADRDVIFEDVIPDLSILYSGGPAANPQELLSRPRFRELLDFCVPEYDVVIIDTPPANLSSDSRYIAAVAGSSVVVARKDHTLVHDVSTLVDELTRGESRVIGTVLTDY